MKLVLFGRCCHLCHYVTVAFIYGSKWIFFKLRSKRYFCKYCLSFRDIKLKCLFNNVFNCMRSYQVIGLVYRPTEHHSRSHESKEWFCKVLYNQSQSLLKPNRMNETWRWYSTVTQKVCRSFSSDEQRIAESPISSYKWGP